MSTTETRRLSMHPHLLMDVIRRQAGTLHKAILEGVMNAVDAEATEIRIDLTSTNLVIKDNGRGMTDRQTILDFWEVFGQPPQEGSRKIYGQFRMGRGQLMAFGRNLWTTGVFVMDVDIQHTGLEYKLVEAAKPVAGCTVQIELYTPVLPSEKAQIERELAVSIKYAPTKVFFNGELLSTDPDDVKWDQETDEAYIKLRDTGNLYVFNLGVLVCAHPGHVFGCGGEVVSKKQLRVNFARNEVMSDCKVWKKIRPLVDQRAADRINRQPTLTDDGRQRLVDQIKAGELTPEQVAAAKVLTDVNGRHWSPGKLYGYRYGGKITATVAGDNRGDALMQHKLAFVLSNETLERFGLRSVGALLGLLQPHQCLHGFAACSFKDLTAALNEACTLVPEAEWTPHESAVIATLLVASYCLPEKRHAKVLVGLSETVAAWTDAASYIAINRKTIEDYGTSVGDWVRYGLLLIHQYCSETANHEVQYHSPEFWQHVDDMSQQYLAEFVNKCVTAFPRYVAHVGRRLTKRQLLEADKIEKHRQAERRLLNMTEPSDN